MADREVLEQDVDQVARIAGPVGGMWVAYNERGVTGSGFASLETFARFREEHLALTGRGAQRTEHMEPELFATIEDSFCTGDRRPVPLDLRFATPIQKIVWEACCAIPSGDVISVGELARSIHRHNGGRGVVAAMEANPMPVIVPCYRVVRVAGSARAEDVGRYPHGHLVRERLLERESLRAEEDAVRSWLLAARRTG
ncbi:MAG: methylated-DNA--[protein]-cysteine S-methyltransferase [Actinomycetia bacterium]|nr:methylated-DNA--[protein]-cysteine S-methyltransferase [Actinomycetes bacterium]MCP4845530.1 methylated-DNA--[protein]-cysteine S-methyltransferase [Actinomycetes bacterium]